MDSLLVLDKNFAVLTPVDEYESIIWTDRYNSYGDFELYVPASVSSLEYLVADNYLYTPESDHVMIIEKVEIKSSVEDGTYYTITGRSLESILDRRVVWSQTIISNTTSGGLQNGVKTLLNDAIISPSIENRKIDNFIFTESTDETVLAKTLEAQYTGDNLYDVICEICQSANLGFKIILNDSNQFEFSLYAGVDRSFNQDTNPHIIFSKDYDTLISSDYTKDKSTLKTIALVGGEGEGSDRTYATKELVDSDGNSFTGLSRRELFTDARDLSTTTDDGTLSASEYQAELQQRGSEDLAENVIDEGFEAEMDPNSMYEYRSDYDIGDIIQVISDTGLEYTARITEYVLSQDENGVSNYPTFEVENANSEKTITKYAKVEFVHAINAQYHYIYVWSEDGTQVLSQSVNGGSYGYSVVIDTGFIAFTSGDWSGYVRLTTSGSSDGSSYGYIYDSDGSTLLQQITLLSGKNASWNYDSTSIYGPVTATN